MCASGQYGDIRLCAAIVGYADLRFGDEVGWLLDRSMAAAPDRFRGIRQSTMEHPSDAPFRWNFTGHPPEGISRHPKFRDGLRQVAKRGLTFDATGFHHQLPEISDLAEAFPDTTIVINHMTTAAAVDMSAQERADLFREWQENLRNAARRPNVMCKIGGLGMPMWGFAFHERQDPVGYQGTCRRVASLCRGGDRGVWRRPLYDGKQLSTGWSLLWLRSLLERLKAHCFGI